MDDINTHLLAFERSLKQDTSKPQLATTMVMFMVQGLFTPLSFPYAQFPSSNVTELLFDHFCEAVYHLERLQLKVSMYMLEFTFHVHLYLSDKYTYIYLVSLCV